jgi:hypothetical protein
MTSKDGSLSQPFFPSSTRISEEETQPLPGLAGLAFRAFLAKYGLSMLDVALVAGVRLLTIWKIGCNRPVEPRQAEQVRAALYRLTGTCYRGGIVLRQEGVDDQK